MGDRVAELTDSLAAVRARLDAACAAAGRSTEDVKLLPVTKFFPVSDVAILYEIGCRDFGESREQEASAKVAELSAEDVRWHMIGHLQRNKAKSVAAWAQSIHSVDSARLVNALEKAVVAVFGSGERDRPLDVLLQVSLDGDVHRGGVERDALGELADQVENANGLRLAGLMAVPPLDSDADRAFADLAAIAEAVRRDHPDATQLSAGMTGDLEEAVAHGSTCVRVGTAIMGARPITSP